MSDQDSLDQHAESEDSFRQIFDRHYPRVARYFRIRGFSEAEAEDLSQETFLRIFQGIKSFRREAHFTTWIYAIAHHVSANEIRRRATEKRSGHEISLEETRIKDFSADTDHFLSPTDGGPLADALAEERVRQLRQALLDLPPMMRQCIILRTDQGLKYREIAIIMGTSIDTVKTMLYQARQRLQRKLGDYYPEGIEE